MKDHRHHPVSQSLIANSNSSNDKIDDNKGNEVPLALSRDGSSLSTSSSTITSLLTTSTTTQQESSSSSPKQMTVNNGYLNFFHDQVQKHKGKDDVTVETDITPTTQVGCDVSPDATDSPPSRTDEKRRTTTQFARQVQTISPLWKQLSIDEQLRWEKIEEQDRNGTIARMNSDPDTYYSSTSGVHLTRKRPNVSLSTKTTGRTFPTTSIKSSPKVHSDTLSGSQSSSLIDLMSIRRNYNICRRRDFR